MKYSQPFDFSAYLALSQFNQIAPFLGITFTKREMTARIKRLAKKGGFKPVRIRVLQEGR